MRLYFIFAWLVLSGASFAQSFSDKSKLQIGDFVYFDGTFTHRRINSKKCIGVLISKQMTTEDKKHGWSTGVVISLEDLGEGALYKWGPKNASIGDYRYEALDTLSTAYEVFNALKNMDKVNFPNSGWNLPTSKQWDDMLDNIGHRQIHRTNNERKWPDYTAEEISEDLNNKIGGFILNDRHGYWLSESSYHSTAHIGDGHSSNNGGYHDSYNGRGRWTVDGLPGFVGDRQQYRRGRAVFMF